MARLKAIEALLQDFSRQRPLRGGSLIITLFGDSISQHGNSVWLGSIIRTLEPFGLNSRLIRTAVHRLVQEGWLCARTVGRRAYYSFTDTGLRRYEKAAQRIYAAGVPEWDGAWTLVLCGRLRDEGRDRLRRELAWLGFGSANPQMLIHPGAAAADLEETLRDIGVTDEVVVLDARTAGIVSEQALRGLAEDSWPLADIAERYEVFLDKFRPVLSGLQKAKSISGEDAFEVRTLLVHEYRRILLRDSDLPAQLLPANWVGTAALELVTRVYRLVDEAAGAHIVATMETADGPLPGAAPSSRHRFS